MTILHGIIKEIFEIIAAALEWEVENFSYFVRGRMQLFMVIHGEFGVCKDISL